MGNVPSVPGLFRIISGLFPDYLSKPPPPTEEQQRFICALAVQARYSGNGNAPFAGSDPANSVAYGTTVYQNKNLVMNAGGARAGQGGQAAVAAMAQGFGKYGDMVTCVNH
jgi:hypothetical protein